MHERRDGQIDALPRAVPTPMTRRHRALIDTIHGELAQVDTLMSDATAKLLLSFDAMARDRMVAASKGERSAEAATGMERAMTDAVTALQFHDIASQLLASIAAHVERLEGVNPTGACPPETHRDDRLHDRPDLRTSVTQTTMAVGTVELF